MIKKQTLIAVFLFGSAVFSGATPAQTLRIGLTTDLDTLDPTLSRTFSSGVVRVTMCDRLFDIGLELEIVPKLANEWQWTDDKKGASDQAASWRQVPRRRALRRGCGEVQYRAPFDDGRLYCRARYQCDQQCRNHR